ncbi:DUF1707 domain-containing protein [Nocardioides dubius]|uniref:DUF1707 domain-containing protein n=1 Tax=Nocardioides dubius TaxID=317019 RepID=A0ABP4EHZ5_9ACTN
MRARDVDRNDVVEALEAAFVDGQLTADEREERVAAALGAVELDDLRVLVKDLQNAPERFRPGVVASVRAAATATSPRRNAVIVAAVAGIVGIGLVINAIVSDDPLRVPDSSISADADAEAEAQAVSDSASFVVMWSDVKNELTSGQPANQREGEVPSLEPWEVTAERVRDLLEVIHNQFDAPYLTELGLRPDYFSFTRPLKGTQPRTEDWSYSKGSGVRASDPEIESGRDLALFDTRDIDVDALFRNLDAALTNLNVEDAKLSWIDVKYDSSTEIPVINIWVTNRFEESGWMETTLDGLIYKSWPYTES